MVTFTCVAANIVFIALAYFLRHLGTTTLLGILLVSAFIFIGAIYYSRPKNRAIAKNKSSNNIPSTSIIKSHKILSLAPESVEAE
jgi:hypothetical protein